MVSMVVWSSQQQTRVGATRSDDRKKDSKGKAETHMVEWMAGRGTAAAEPPASDALDRDQDDALVGRVCCGGHKAGRGKTRCRAGGRVPV